MARKKKPTRKYEPLDEFRYNRSKEAANHPQYVFGRKGERLRSVGLTTHPKKEYKHIKLTKNPNPEDARESYIQTQVFKTKSHLYSDPLPNWKFAKEDVPIARHIKKQYKKKQNKKRR